METKLSNSEIKELLAQSGKCTKKEMMHYLKTRFDGRYDIKLAKEIADELVKQIN